MEGLTPTPLSLGLCHLNEGRELADDPGYEVGVISGRGHCLLPDDALDHRLNSLDDLADGSGLSRPWKVADDVHNSPGALKGQVMELSGYPLGLKAWNLDRLNSLGTVTL